MPKGVKKKPKVAGTMRHIVADNVRALMALRWPHSTNRSKDLERVSGVSDSTIQRITVAENGLSVDNLELIARAFDLQPYQLLIVGLDVRKPQTAPGAKPLPKRPITVNS